MDDPDADLLRRCARRRAGAFHELFERFARRVQATAFRITGSAHDAEDILQEVFLKIHARLRGFEFRSTVSLWVHKITAHESLNFKRKATRDPRPATHAQQAQHEETMSMLQRLSAPLRAVMVLRYASGFSYQEISELMDLPIGTVRSRLHEAHLNLREEEAP